MLDLLGEGSVVVGPAQIRGDDVQYSVTASDPEGLSYMYCSRLAFRYRCFSPSAGGGFEYGTSGPMPSSNDTERELDGDEWESMSWTLTRGGDGYYCPGPNDVLLHLEYQRFCRVDNLEGTSTHTDLTLVFVEG